MSSKLKLVAAPTFKATVGIPVAGGDAENVEFTFKHRTKDQLDAWLRTERSDVQAILDMAEGWGFDEPLNSENVETLVQNRIAAPEAVLRKYLDELTKAKAKN